MNGNTILQLETVAVRTLKTGLLAGAAALLLTAALLQAQGVKVKVFSEPSEDWETPQAVVLSVQGKCDYSVDGQNFSALKPGRVLKQGAVVRTGDDSRTDLFFRRIGTTVRVQPGTEILLEKMARRMIGENPVLETALVLRSGRIFTVVRSLVPGSTFEIKNALGRSVVEGGGGKGRYIITADGSHVTDKDSAIPDGGVNSGFYVRIPFLNGSGFR